MRIRAMTLMALVSWVVFPAFSSAVNDISIDFEDMTLGDLAGSSSGGTATFDVVEKNNSNRGHIRHVSGTAAGDESSLSLTVAMFQTRSCHLKWKRLDSSKGGGMALLV